MGTDPPDTASPKQPPDAAPPDPRLQPRTAEDLKPRVAAGAVEPPAVGGAGQPRVEPLAVEPHAGTGAVEPRAGAPRPMAGAVEPRVAVGAGKPRAAVGSGEPLAVEPHAGAGSLEARPMADAVEQRAGEPYAATGAMTDLPNAKLWNALDTDFAAAMDVELAILLDSMAPEVQFLPRLMPAPMTERLADPAWVPPEGMDPLSTYFLEIRVMRKGNRQDFSLPIVAYTTNYKDFLDDIAEKYSLALDEIETIHYNDGRKKHSIRRDQDLTAMFECFEPAKKGRVTIIMKDIDKYLENPFPQFEHVGVNEENQYLVGESGEGDDDESGEGDDVGDDSGTDDDYEPSEGEEGHDVEGSNEGSADDEEWVAKDANPDVAPAVAYDMDDPPMEVGTIYPSIKMLRLAVAQYAIKREFEYNIEKSEPKRFRVNCVVKGYRWRIHASTLEDDVTFEIKIHHESHDCCSTRKSEKVKSASKTWIADKVSDWLREDPGRGTKELQGKLKDKYKVLVPYKRVWTGRELAMKNLFGDWDGSFDKLYGWKAEVEKRSPGSIVCIDHMTFKEKKRFTRLFVAFKPCIDGFLAGCRPYLAIDSTHLTGKYRGQLATACALDGHNWLYPVAFGVIDSETNENWVWFMEKLREAIGTPPGLAICSDAGKGIDNAIDEVFGYAEHRECMRHLATNFKHKYRGKVFDEHLWPAAYSWTLDEFERHMAAMGAMKPQAIAYLNTWHKRLWTRSKFSPNSKVDYVTNNLAECFNNWINKHKGLMLFELCDAIRKKLMAKFLKRKRVANKLEGHIILPSVMQELHAKSRNLDFELERNDDIEAEVTENGPNGKRHIVDLKQRTCTCREWQVSGKPCVHALCFLSAIRFKLEPYVHDCYSVAKFKAAYASRIPALTDISQWPKNTHDFYLHPPILKRSAGRPSTERVKGVAKGKPKGRKGRHQCPICKGYGHSWKKCKDADPEAKEAYAKQPKKRPKKKVISTSPQAIGLLPATTSSEALVSASTTTTQPLLAAGTSMVVTEAATPPAKGTRRRKRRYVPASPDSPSMGTRSKKRLVV